MKKLFIILILLAWAGSAWGANCGGITACNCGDTITSSYTFAADLACTNAGASLTISANSVVVNLGGHTLSGDGVNTTIGVSNTNYDGITITNGTISGYTTNGIAMGGTTDNVAITHLTFSNLAGSGTRYIIIAGGTGITITDNTFNQPLVSGYALITSGAVNTMDYSRNVHIGPGVGTGRTSQYAIYFYTVTGLTFSGNTITDWDLNAVSDKLVYFRDCPSVTSSNNIIGSTGHTNDGYGYYVTNSTASAITFVATGDIVTGQSYHGMYFVKTGAGATNATLTACQSNYNINGDNGVGFLVDTGAVVTATGSTANGNRASNWRVQNTGVLTGTTLVGSNADSTSAGSGIGFVQFNGATLTCSGCISFGNSEDGFSANNTGSMTLTGCLSYSNGADAKASSGDGYTGHDTSVVKLHNCVAYDNLKSGYASGSGHTGGAGSEIYNCSFYNNYSAAKAGLGGGINIPSAGIWAIKNNITANHDIEIRIGTAAGGTYDIDYNDYYTSRETNAFIWNGSTYNFADWKTNSSKDAHSLSANPLFMSVTNFHIKASSPCKNTGTDVGLTTDFDGKSYSSTFPMGAYKALPPLGGGGFGNFGFGFQF